MERSQTSIVMQKLEGKQYIKHLLCFSVIKFCYFWFENREAILYEEPKESYEAERDDVVV